MTSLERLESARRNVPSLRRRVVVSAALLVGFYAVTLGVACLLVGLSFVVWWAGRPNFGTLLVIACLWTPAVALVRGALRSKTGRPASPGPTVFRHEAPELFAMLDELASAAGTLPPTNVHLSPRATLGVREVSDWFGSDRRRILILGAPLLDVLTVQELRSGLAHELGHFVGGDTRFLGVLAHTEASLRSLLIVSHRPVASSNVLLTIGAEASRYVGSKLVDVYGRLYLRLTRPDSRRQELYADALSAALAGRDAAVRTLEKVHVFGAMYEAYLECDVAPAVNRGAVPSDLIEGFRTLRARYAERGVDKELLEKIRDAAADPFDTHPSLAERVAAFDAWPRGTHVEDERLASVLLPPKVLFVDLVDATVEDLRTSPKAVTAMPWREVARGAQTAACIEAGRSLACHIEGMPPYAQFRVADVLVRVTDAFERGLGPDLLRRLVSFEGVDASKVAGVAVDAGAWILTLLLEAALLEGGAERLPSLGEADTHVIFEGASVVPRALAAAAMEGTEGAGVFKQWALRLAASHASLPIPPATTMPFGTFVAPP